MSLQSTYLRFLSAMIVLPVALSPRPSARGLARGSPPAARLRSPWLRTRGVARHRALAWPRRGAPPSPPPRPSRPRASEPAADEACAEGLVGYLLARPKNGRP